MSSSVAAGGAAGPHRRRRALTGDARNASVRALGVATLDGWRDEEGLGM